MVAAEIDSPGIPNSMEVISPVVDVTASIPRRNANASTGFISKVKGSMSARVVTPPTPGRIPTTNPAKIPISNNGNVG
jgi:hypothetical protein